MQRRRVDGLALPEEQQHAFVGQVRREVAVDAAIAVALGVGEQVVEMNEGEAGGMNKAAHPREMENPEAKRGNRPASPARARRPPPGELQKQLVDLLVE